MLIHVRQCQTSSQTVTEYVSIVFWYIIFSVNDNTCQTMSGNVRQAVKQVAEQYVSIFDTYYYYYVTDMTC